MDLILHDTPDILLPSTLYHKIVSNWQIFLAWWPPHMASQVSVLYACISICMYMVISYLIVLLFHNLFHTSHGVDQTRITKDLAGNRGLKYWVPRKRWDRHLAAARKRRSRSTRTPRHLGREMQLEDDVGNQQLKEYSGLFTGKLGEITG